MARLPSRRTRPPASCTREAGPLAEPTFGCASKPCPCFAHSRSLVIAALGGGVLPIPEPPIDHIHPPHPVEPRAETLRLLLSCQLFAVDRIVPRLRGSMVKAHVRSGLTVRQETAGWGPALENHRPTSRASIIRERGAFLELKAGFLEQRPRGSGHADAPSALMFSRSDAR